MKTNVPVQDKKEFIRYMLTEHQMKKRESVWILNYLMSHDDIIENVHFVENAQYCPRGIVMSTRDTEFAPFRFYKNGIMTTDAEKSFHDIRLNREEPLYVQVNFPASFHTSQFVMVLEENPHAPKHLLSNERDQMIAERILTDSIVQFRRDRLLKQIDEALDARDMERFQQLCSELKTLR